MLRTLRRRMPAIICVALIFSAIGFGIGKIMPRSYTATAKVVLASPISVSLLGSSPSTVESARAAATELEILNSDPVVLATDKAVGHRISVSVSPVTNANVAVVSATANAGSRAVADADAYVKNYITLRTGQLSAIIKTATTSLQTEITATTAALKPLDDQVSAASSTSLPAVLALIGPERDALLTHKSDLENRLADLTLRNVVADALPKVAAAATIPSASGPGKPPLFAVIGLVIGLLLGVGMAVVLERSLGRVHDEEDVRNAGVDAPMVVSLPASRKQSGILLGNAQSTPEAAAYRRVAAALTMGLAPGADHTLTVLPVHTQSSTAAQASNLALALASLGRSVALVDVDLDRPSLHELFGIEGRVGLNNVLQGELPLSEAVGQVRDCDLLLLPAGAPTAGRPPDVSRLPEILRELRPSANVIVLAAASTVTSAVAIAVLPFGDSIALTASRGVVHRSELAEAAEFLKAYGRSAAAVLLVPPQDRRRSRENNAVSPPAEPAIDLPMRIGR